ncbi:MAG: tRNA pseudouridine(55) synthase TruB [Planctomycetota bacterium]
MFGLITLDKPAGPTSHDMVARIRRLVPRRTKVGHAGTLDPFATGVLVVCVGPATRLADHVAAGAKRYEAEITFGAVSTTDDPTGTLSETHQPPPSVEHLREALTAFVGEIEQVPPAHSAVHVNGQRAYTLARAERPVDLPARTVRVDAVELLGFDGRRARVRIDCGKGTYIRSIARDLGARLGCGAYCSALRRTAVGAFTIDDAVDPDALTPDNLGEDIQPARLAVADRPAITLDAAALEDALHGRPVPCGDLTGDAAAVDESGQLVAVGSARQGRFQPSKVFRASRA